MKMSELTKECLAILVKDLEECIDLLSIDGQNTKKEVKERLEKLYSAFVINFQLDMRW